MADDFPDLKAAAAQPQVKKGKKNKGTKMGLDAFLAETSTGASSSLNWADEVEDLPTGPKMRDSDEVGGGRFNTGSFARDSAFSGRAEVPLPTGPPYTAFCGNLSFDATEGGLTDFFGGGTAVSSVRLVRDPMDQKLKGFGYIEFTSLDALKAGLALSGTPYDGRPVRVNVADTKSDRQGSGGFGDRGARGDFDPNEGRSAGAWERRGPLADVPGGRDSSRGPPRREFEGGMGRDEPRQGGFGFAAGPESSEPREWGAVRGGKFVASADPPERGSRFSSAEPPERGSRFAPSEPPERGSRFVPSTSRVSSGTSTPLSPLAGGSDDGGPPGPPRGEMASTWRRAAPVASEETSTPPSPSQSTTRRPLQLAARSVSTTSATGSESPTSATSAKPSPFGAARPVDTAARERQISASSSTATEQPRRTFSTASQRSESGGGKPRVDPFGNAKPVDTAAKEAEITAKLEKTKLISPPTPTTLSPAAASSDAPATAAASEDAALKETPASSISIPVAPKVNPWQRPVAVTETNGEATPAEKQVEADTAKETTSEAEPRAETETTV